MLAHVPKEKVEGAYSLGIGLCVTLSTIVMIAAICMALSGRGVVRAEAAKADRAAEFGELQ